MRVSYFECVFKTRNFFISFFCSLLLQSCSVLPKQPVTQGESKSTYSYIPLDPLPINTEDRSGCTSGYNEKSFIDSLPDQAVRIAVGQYDSTGTLVFGPVKIGTQGHSYQIILDYINIDAANVPILVERTADVDSSFVSVFDTNPKGATQYRVFKETVTNKFQSNDAGSRDKPKTSKAEKVIIPVYLGIGLRLTASITVIKGTANLSSLGAIAADAEAGKLTGSLVVQTLGITGKSISTSLPLPSELNQTTIQNAILALGSIKAVLYDKENTLITPRVVGIYNPIGGGPQVVNGIISILSSDPIIWNAKCEKIKDK